MSLSINELRILLVEPSDVQRKVIGQHLMQAQLTETRGASTIAEAKTLIREWQPDIVTSAMYFEDGTAHQLIDFIHASNLEDTVHFMLVSSEHRPDQLSNSSKRYRCYFTNHLAATTATQFALLLI